MSDISTTETLDSSNDSLKKQIYTSLPARVISFNASEQTVSIELMIEQIDYQGNQLPLPPLVDVPVKMFAWGQFFITAEPQAGDEGLAVFSARCIDGWWESGRKSVPLDIRFHDLSDAFFDGGYRSKPKVLTIVPNCLNIGSESSYIRIGEDGTIEIKGATEFLDVVTAPDFVTTSGISLNNHRTSGVSSGSQTSGPPVP